MVSSYEGKTEAQKDEVRRKRRERYQREKAARLAQEQSSDGTKVGASPEFVMSMEVEDIGQPPKQSFADRILSHFKGDETEDEEEVVSKKRTKTSREKEREEKSDKLISHIIPLTISGMIAVFSRRLFSERYKPCAPTQEEASTVLLPMFSIIARHVEIEGKASQDVIDIAASIIASLTIGIRMLMTAEMIRNGEYNEQAQSTDSQGYATNGSNGTRAASGYSPVESVGTVQNTASQNGAIQYGGWGYDAANGNARDGAIGIGDTDRIAYERAKVSELLRKDTVGRRAMGLAPRNLSGQNGT